MRRGLVPLAVGMAALYLALAVGAAGCFSTPFEQPHTGHHQTHVPHSAFCAWACQANPTVSALVEAPPAVVFQLVVLLILVRTTRTARLAVDAAHPRAPPSF